MNRPGPEQRVRARPAISRVRVHWAAVVGVVLLALNMRPAIAEIPPILTDLGLSRAGESLLATVPVVCFGLAALAAPSLRRWLGEERGLLGVLGLLLVGVLLRAAWPDWALFPGTILAGCAIAVMNVLLPSLVRRRFPGQVGLMTGVYTTALVIGGSAAAGLTVPLRDSADGSLHVALGIWAVPILAAILAWLPQSRHRALPAVTGGREAIRALGRSPVAWHVTLFMGLQSMMFYASLSWLPAIHRDQGIDPATAGLLLSTMNLLGIPGTFLAPTLAGRMHDQRRAMLLTVSLTIAGLLGVMLAPPSTAAVWMVVMGLGQGSALGLALLLIVVRAADDHTAARLSSMAQGFGYLLAAAGPLLVGLLHAITDDWTVPLACLVGLALAELAAGLAAARRRTVAAGG